MSTVSRLRNPISGSVVPDELLIEQPRRQTGRRAKTAAKRQARLKPMLAMSVCALLMFAVCGGLMFQKARLMKLTYQLAQMQDELAALQKEESFLQMELISARSLRQVEETAVTRLGMVKPERVEYLVWTPPNDERVEVAAQSGRRTTDTGWLTSVSRWFSDNWPLVGRAEAKSRY